MAQKVASRDLEANNNNSSMVGGTAQPMQRTDSGSSTVAAEAEGQDGMRSRNGEEHSPDSGGKGGGPAPLKSSSPTNLGGQVPSPVASSEHPGTVPPGGPDMRRSISQAAMDRPLLLVAAGSGTSQGTPSPRSPRPGAAGGSIGEVTLTPPSQLPWLAAAAAHQARQLQQQQRGGGGGGEGQQGPGDVTPLYGTVSGGADVDRRLRAAYQEALGAEAGGSWGAPRGSWGRTPSRRPVGLFLATASPDSESSPAATAVSEPPGDGQQGVGEAGTSGALSQEGGSQRPQQQQQGQLVWPVDAVQSRERGGDTTAGAGLSPPPQGPQQPQGIGSREAPPPPPAYDPGVYRRASAEVTAAVPPPPPSGYHRALLVAPSPLMRGAFAGPLSLSGLSRNSRGLTPAGPPQQQQAGAPPVYPYPYQQPGGAGLQLQLPQPSELPPRRTSGSGGGYAAAAPVSGGGGGGYAGWPRAASMAAAGGGVQPFGYGLGIGGGGGHHRTASRDAVRVTKNPLWQVEAPAPGVSGGGGGQLGVRSDQVWQAEADGVTRNPLWQAEAGN